MAFSGRLRWKATIAVLCTILFLAGVFLLWGVKSRQVDMQRLIVEHQMRIGALIKLGNESAFTQYNQRIQNLVRARTEIVNAFAMRDRELLRQLVQPLYENVLMQENAFFSVMQFHTEANEPFLNIHSQAAGDDAAEISPMVAECNKSRRQVSGYETGKGGVFYRVMQPVMHGDAHVGTIEFGIKVQGIIERVGEENNVEMAIFLDPQQGKKSALHGQPHVVETDSFTIVKGRKNVFDTLPKGFSRQNMGERQKINGHWYVFVRGHELKDYWGNAAAEVVFAQNITELVQEFQQFSLFSVILTLVVVIVAFIILYFSFGTLLNELYVVNDSLAASKTELEKYRTRLEEIIVERTLDLARTNEDLSLETRQRERAEGELLSSERSLAKAQAIARLGHWEWDVQHDQLRCSEEACRIFGLDRSQTFFVMEDFCRSLHPADHEKVLAWLAELSRAMENSSIEFRITKQNGEERVIQAEGEIVESNNDLATKIICIVQDVTERSHADKQLLLSASVFENSIEGIIITDAEGTMQSVNRAFIEITGFAEEQAIGQNPRILKSDQHDQDFFKAMWDSLLSTGVWQGEIWNRRKDGEVYPQWLTITAIHDDHGKTTNYVGVFHDMTEIKLHEEQLRYQAHHDALTGLPNRVLFRDRLGVAMSHAHRVDLKVGVLFLDLDDFKRINDSLGHTVGDFLLQDVAKRLERCLREEDTVARYGGDEFIVLLGELSHEEDAIVAAQRILKAISPAICMQNQEFYLTVSLGIAFYPKDGLDQETLIRNADTAMYRAKAAGKNTYQVFTPAMSKKVSEWLAVENSLRKALEREEFFLHYQPKIDMHSGTIAGVEALIRWRQEDGEIISPNEFIPLAEDTGLIVEIGGWVLKKACADIKKLLDRGYRITLSVNISPRQFRQENLPEKVAQVLEETGFPPEALLLEITEGTVMDSEEKSLLILNELKDMGIGLSIDDFGTGYSSLYYLKQLPIKELKIDRKFVRDIPKDEDDLAITSAIISMAKSLKLQVVAEGVESEEQMKVLRKRRCDQVQGFLFSKAIADKDLLELLSCEKQHGPLSRQGRSQISLPF